MRTLNKFLPALALAAFLAPAAASARGADVSNGPGQALIAVSGAAQAAPQHGRAAERQNVPVTASIAGSQPQLAASDDGFSG